MSRGPQKAPERHRNQPKAERLRLAYPKQREQQGLAIFDWLLKRRGG